VFRGVLARSLGRRYSLVVAAAISSLVFSAYHLSPVQALPTFTLGLVLGAIAIRADSVLPTMLAHGLNNAMAIAMSRGELSVASGWLDQHPVAAVIGCAAATATGVVIAVFEPRSGGAAAS
jgi:membrane protease YdiL (CAAX protease family)